MSFGKRTHFPAPARPGAAPATGRTRRGGYWLGVLTVPIATLLATVVMALSPLTNPTAVPLARVLAVVPGALLNITVVAAILMLPIDLVLRRLNWRRPWIYALVCGVVVFMVCGGLLMLTGLRNGFWFMVGMSFVPPAAGGWVMGVFRR